MDVSMTFPQEIERWRSTVRDGLASVLTNNPSKKALLSSLSLTFDGLTDIILALIQKESYGDADAIGDDGNSIGLMQLNYGAGTPQGEGFSGTKEDLKDPDTNLYYGSKYFLTQLAKYGDVDKAILAYNAGSFRVSAGGIPINLEYLKAILSFLGEKKTSFSFSRQPQGSGGGSVETKSSIERINAGDRASAHLDINHNLMPDFGPRRDEEHKLRSQFKNIWEDFLKAIHYTSV